MVDFKSSFQQRSDKDDSVTIHHRNLKTLVTEIYYKTASLKDKKYNLLRNSTLLFLSF